MFCSCLAGVYNELLLKSTDTENCNIYIQNVFMYVDSIICNLALLMWQGEVRVLWDVSALSQLLHLKVSFGFNMLISPPPPPPTNIKLYSNTNSTTSIHFQAILFLLRFDLNPTFKYIYLSDICLLILDKPISLLCFVQFLLCLDQNFILNIPD